ncbi:peptidylprolyl isomerase [Deefgea piscis]|uniref:Periplasmic chaperone PpiD n=1 Tax=Deefgea piscis TaxID=2739061 RepID=A0A6M8SK25_9NEIS|nr:peptidylprolyl isomerase [Deefgea piscis]QKJ65425.1 peptidylprolyl isomerase [Deefgea piscis]
MFDIVNKNKTAVTVVLGLVSLGLVVGLGLSGYTAMDDESTPYLAKVGGYTITDRHLEEAIGNQAIPDNMKPMVLEQLVRQRLLQDRAIALKLAAPDQLVRNAIMQIPAFQVDGQFNDQRYQEILASQQMTPAIFEEKMRQDIVMRQLMDGFVQTGFVSNAAMQQLNQLMAEKREVATATISAEQYLPQVTVSDAEVKKYFDAHQADYKKPEMVKVEYLLLSQSDLAAAQTVSDAEVEKYFAEHKQELAKEERRASHILIAVDKSAKAADKTAARKQAEEILAQVKANPARFAELAKQKSQDPGSAVNGGDLGFFAKGMMVKPFDEVAFKLNKGEISNLVETDFGFHIIQLNDVKSTSLADVKPSVVEKLKQQKTQSQFPAQIEKFTELVYQQSNSLKPTADALKLAVKQSDWLTRSNAADPLLGNPKMIEAIYSDDVLKAKHNSEALELAPGQWVSARVLEYKPASTQSLLEVTPMITAKLKQEKALALAQADGAKKLAALQAGQVENLAWGPAQAFTRVAVEGVSDANLKAIFKANTSKLPAYVGGAVPGRGYVIYKVIKAIDAPALSAEDQFRMQENLAKMYGQVEMSAFIDAIRKDVKVKYQAKPKAE